MQTIRIWFPKVVQQVYIVLVYFMYTIFPLVFSDPARTNFFKSHGYCSCYNNAKEKWRWWWWRGKCTVNRQVIATDSNGEGHGNALCIGKFTLEIELLQLALCKNCEKSLRTLTYYLQISVRGSKIEIWLSFVQVPLWPPSGIFLCSPWFKSWEKIKLCAQYRNYRVSIVSTASSAWHCL